MGVREKQAGLVLYVALMTTLLLMGTCLPILAQADKPRSGGTLRVLYLADPTTLNGILNIWTRTGYINQLVLSKLLRYDENYKIIPYLAKSYEVSADGRVFTYHLRDDVYWHDGVKFTSADVKFHYMKAMNYSTYVTSSFKNADLRSIDTPDDYTVVFRFGKFYPSVPGVGAMNPVTQFILPKHIFEKGDFEKNPANLMLIGTGPFKVQEYNKDKNIILVANDKYFLGRPYLDKIIITFQRDPTAALVALEAGSVDLVWPSPGIPLPEIGRVNTIPGLKAAGYATCVTWRLTFNFRDEAWQKNPWLKDVKVREAIARSIDKKGIIKAILGGITIPNEGPISELIKDYYDDASVVKYEYDLTKAETLLDEAGYKRGSDGIRFKATMIGYQSAAEMGFFQAVQQSLKKVGIDVEMRPVDDTAFYATYEFGPNAPRGMQDFPFALGTMIGGPEPFFNWYSIPPPVGEDFGFYSTFQPEAKPLWDKIGAEPNMAARKQLVNQMQRMITQDIGYVFLWSVPAAYAYRTEFANVDEDMQPFANHALRPMTTIWWTKAPVATTTTAPATTTAQPPASAFDMTTIGAVVLIVVIAGAAFYMSKRKKTAAK